MTSVPYPFRFQIAKVELELPLVVVDPVARVYPVIIVPIRMRGTETGSVQPADRRVRVKQEAVLLVLQVLRLEKYPDVSLILDGAEARRSGPPEIPPDQGAARNFDVSPEGTDVVCEVSLICPRSAVVVWVAEIGIVRHFLAVEAADVVDDPLAEDAFVDHLLNVPIRHRLVNRERARAFGNDVHSRRPEPVVSLSLGALQRLDGAVEVLVYGQLPITFSPFVSLWSTVTLMFCVPGEPPSFLGSVQAHLTSFSLALVLPMPHNPA